jgi:hypothetical protein
MEVLLAQRLSRLKNAILSIVQWIVWLGIGQIGQRALHHVMVAIVLAPDLS